MTCTDYARHELILLGCTHAGQGGTEILVRFEDGCSGRLCPECDAARRVKDQPDLAERTAGPGPGLDILELLRARPAEEQP